MTRQTLRLACCALLVSIAVPAADLGFVCSRWPIPDDRADAKAALAAARRAGNVTVILTGPDGALHTTDGAPVTLGDLPVVWVHEGDSSAKDGWVFSGALSSKLRAYVRSGGACLLSGAAFHLLGPVAGEKLPSRVGGPGKDGVEAAFVILVDDHPLFAGFGGRGTQIPVTSAGHPAFSDFHATNGPSSGALLARTPGGSENPVVEYAPGRGRVLGIGWRLPHYSQRPNAHAANLQRLTTNAIAYLATRDAWKTVTVHDAGRQAIREALAIAEGEFDAIEAAVRDLQRTFGDDYPNAEAYLAELERLRKAELQADDDQAAAEHRAAVNTLKRRALLANPLLDATEILAIRRSLGRLGLPANWQSNSSLPHRGYDNHLAAVTMPRDGVARRRDIHRPPDGRFIGDVDLHPDGRRALFSSPGSNGRWQVFELDLGRGAAREVPLIQEPDVDNYDACYLPNGDLLFTSTAPFVGVPCVQGNSHVATLFLRSANSGSIRQLSYDQDHNWCPCVLPDGRVLYQRWEYADIPHFVSRMLFTMSPDGTNQMAHYGTNSYWPNALFYARGIPFKPTQFIAVVGGHHGVPRMGELVLFDTARGRREADGALQHIPGRGKTVIPIIRDQLVNRSWPRFLHPWPLGHPRGTQADAARRAAAGTYFLVSAQLANGRPWGLYLADTFDNLVPIIEEPGYAWLEPVPLAARVPEPVLPARVDPDAREATVVLQDIYAGPGLRGVPRGSVKRLRLVGYHFAYHGMGGQVNRVGLDGPWDVKRILGTVPVEADGSAHFRVPANTPISLQPLDADGKALQLMRSWLTAMPGETLSCVGCHEHVSGSPVASVGTALQRPADVVEPWYGPPRGFSFIHEVQPVLDAYCVRCHDGTADGAPRRPDFSARPAVHTAARSAAYNNGTTFPPSYLALRAYVRTPTIESDIHLLPPGEFHADTTKLVQMLRAGHHGVRLDPEAWGRLVTWIDLHAPAHGTWAQVVGEKKVAHQHARRQVMMARYAGRDDDPEALPPVAYAPPGQEEAPAPAPRPTATPAGPTSTAAAGPDGEIALAPGIAISLVRLPIAANGLWMARTEVTNAQYARFDPAHDSRLEHGDFLQFSVRERGYPLNDPEQPVVRISWDRAVAFCRWLSERTGLVVDLPTASEWEAACRADSGRELWYGAPDSDFSRAANLADARLRSVDTFGWGLPSGAIPPWRPAVVDVDDGHRVSAPVASFQPNPWGLHDMHGNVAEWTLSETVSNGRRRRIVCGGSWYDRPARATASGRRDLLPYMGAFDTGFRIVCRSAAPAPREPTP